MKNLAWKQKNCQLKARICRMKAHLRVMMLTTSTKVSIKQLLKTTHLNVSSVTKLIQQKHIWKLIFIQHMKVSSMPVISVKNNTWLCGDVLIHFFPLLFSVPHSFKTFAYLLYLYIWYFAQDYITLYIDGPVLGCEGDSDKCWSWHSSQIVRRLPLESRV